MRCVIYCRTSLTDQSEYSLEDQEARCRAFAQLQGWTVVKVYVDDGGSGQKVTRKAFMQMRSDLAVLGIGALVVYDLDRFMRNLREQLVLKHELDQRKVKLVSLSDNGVIDTSTPEGMLNFQVKGMVSEFQARTTGRKVRDNLEYKAKQGKYVGPVPFGYRKNETGDLVESEDAPIVRLIFDMYRSGVHSFSTIADALNDRGHQAYDWQTKTRNRFGRETIRTILRNPAYIGIVRCNDREYPGAHPPLITREAWDAAVALRDERKSKGGKSSASLPKRGGLLTELAYCYSCNEPMWYQHSGRKTSPGRYYVCRGRSRRTCDAGYSNGPLTEEQALDILRQLTLPREWKDEVYERASRVVTAPQPKRTVTPAMIKDQLRRLGLSFSLGDLDEATYRKERERLNALLVTNAEPPVLLDLRSSLDLLSNMKELVDHADEEERRALLRMVFDGVWLERRDIKAIAPTRAFLPLVGAIQGVCTQMGCLTGDKPQFFKTPPYWLTHCVAYVSSLSQL